MTEMALSNLTPSGIGSLEKGAFLWKYNTIKVLGILSITQLEIKPIILCKVCIIIQTLKIRKLNHKEVKCFLQRGKTTNSLHALAYYSSWDWSITVSKTNRSLEENEITAFGHWRISSLGL